MVQKASAAPCVNSMVNIRRQSVRVPAVSMAAVQRRLLWREMSGMGRDTSEGWGKV